MDASAENERGKEKEEEAKETKATDADAGVSSPSALLAESASRRARRRLARRARGGARARRWKRTRASRRARPRGGGGGARRVGRGDTDSKRTEGEDVHARVSGGVSDAALEAAAALRADGNASFRRGDVHAAIETFTEALAHVPDDVAALANRAAARLRLGEWAAAERDASACLSLDAKHEKALHRRAGRGPAWGTTKAR